MTKNVIIIEDCYAISYLIKTVLKKDFNITLVKNCKDAMIHLRLDVDMDLIILNISDKNSENLELLEHMSTSCILNDIYTVVISDSDDEQLKNKIIELGASLFLTKPFDPVYLHTRVRDLIDPNKNSFGKKRKIHFNLSLFS